MKRCNIFFNNFIKTRVQKNVGACRRRFDIIKYTGLIRGLLHNNSMNEIEMQGGKKREKYFNQSKYNLFNNIVTF